MNTLVKVQEETTVKTDDVDANFYNIQEVWWYRDAVDRADAVLSFLKSLEKQYAETDPYYVTRMWQNMLFAHNTDWDKNERLPQQYDIVKNRRRSNKNDEISKEKLADSTDYLNNIVNNIETNDAIVDIIKEEFDNYLSRVNGITLPNGLTYEHSKNKKTKPQTKVMTSEDLEAEEVLNLATKYLKKKK